MAAARDLPHTLLSMGSFGTLMWRSLVSKWAATPYMLRRSMGWKPGIYHIGARLLPKGHRFAQFLSFRPEWVHRLRLGRPRPSGGPDELGAGRSGRPCDRRRPGLGQAGRICPTHVVARPVRRGGGF